jgi:uncharacterized protein YwgA
MNRLQLATILSWAGQQGLQGRKRLQKVVFFLQEAGCPLDCRYTLHHFGPYSRDVADACDEIVAAGLVRETGGPGDGEMQYTYTLPPATERLLQQTPDAQMQRFQELGKDLLNENIWPLELGSTVLFFYRQQRDWTEALRRACDFKKVRADAGQSQAALALAQRVHAQGRN